MRAPWLIAAAIFAALSYLCGALRDWAQKKAEEVEEPAEEE